MGRFEIVRLMVGYGRELYFAHRNGDPLRRPLILAVLKMRAEDARLLAEEIERCKRLAHGGIMRIVELFEHEGGQVLVFEAARGVSLADLMAHLEKEHERIADGAALHLGNMLFSALAAAHDHTDRSGQISPVIHGQLGPHQILLTWEGDLKILGFGMFHAFRLAQGIEQTPEHMLPFQAPELGTTGAPTAQSNVYTAAAMFWSLLAHRMPPQGAQRIPSLASLRPELPRTLTSTIDLALEPAVRKRDITSREIARVLARLASTAGRRELRWNVEMLRGRESAGDGGPPPASFPPALLSGALAHVDPEEEATVMLSPTDVMKEPPPDEAPTALAPRAQLVPGVGAAPEGRRRPRASTLMGLGGWADEQDWDGEPRAAPIIIEEAPPVVTKPASQAAPAAKARAREGVGGPPPPPKRGQEKRAAATAAPSEPKTTAAPSEPKTTAAPSEPKTTAAPSEPKTTAAPSEPKTTAAVPEADAAPPAASRPTAVSMPLKWFAAVVVLTAAAFAVGLVLGVGPLRARLNKVDAAAVTATTAPGPSAPTSGLAGSPANGPAPGSGSVGTAATAPGAGGSSPTTAPTTEASAASTQAEPGGQQPAEDGDDGSQLPPKLGYLLVRSSAQDAHVYVRGRPTGPVGEKLRVGCGLLPVRLGTNPLTKWLGPGIAVSVACQSLTSVTMEPAAGQSRASTPSPPAPSPATTGRPKPSPRKKPWSPDM